MRLSQSLESWGGGKNPAPSGWRLSITAGPCFKWWVPASLRQMKGPTAALGCWNEGEHNEVLPERRHTAAQAESVLSMVEKNTRAHQILSAPAGETEHPDVKKTIYTEVSLPANTWMTSIFLADKFKWAQKCEKIEQIQIQRKEVGRAFFRFSWHASCYQKIYK